MTWRRAMPVRLVRRLARFWVLVCVSLGCYGQQRSPNPQSTEPTVDLSRSDEIAVVNSAWRVHQGDDLHFASPAFDDSGWVSMPLNERFRTRFTLPISGGVFWARLHLRVVQRAFPAGIAFTDTLPLPYVVYVNGRRLAESPGNASGVLQHVNPFTVTIPFDGDLTLAFRFSYPAFYLPTKFPLARVQVGPLHAVELAQQLETLRGFDDNHVAEIVGIGLFLGLASFAFVLFGLQRSQPEYLWLALFCLLYGITATMKILVESGTLAESDLIMLAYRYAGCFAMICSLEFVTRFAQVTWWRSVRTLEALFLVIPLVGLFSQFRFTASLVLCFVLLLGYMGVCLLRAYQRGVAEVKLLLPFLSLLILVDIFYYASFLSPGTASFPRLHLGSVGVGAEDMTVLFFLAGVMTVVLYRFNRVNREEQHAITEFKSARTLQQSLIPEQPPEIPGFRVASAYLPAQEVGGDFFQVLPLPAAAGALVVLGDVSGKGLEAAMTVAVIVGALRTLAEFTDSPRALMQGLNRRLLDRGAGFSTCIILRLDASGTGIACNAGHLEPYIDGRPVAMDPDLPLGLTADVEYVETAMTLARGQRMTLLTDGVVEAKHPRSAELFGFERTQAISTHSAREIVAAAVDFGHAGAQADDITVLTILRV